MKAMDGDRNSNEVLTWMEKTEKKRGAGDSEERLLKETLTAVCESMEAPEELKERIDGQIMKKSGIEMGAMGKRSALAEKGFCSR